MNRVGVVVVAMACGASDTCVPADGIDCACQAPVNQKELANVQAAGKRAYCAGRFTGCRTHTNPHCGADGFCTAD